MKKKNIEKNENIDVVEEKEEKKKGKKGKFFLILAAVIFFTFIILYLTNSTIKEASNNLFKNVPFIGKTFEAMPTQSEEEKRKKALADYYLSLDTDRAVDKLIILKKEDRTLYDEIVSKMQGSDMATAREILSAQRDKEITKDLVQREIDSMNNEKNNKIKEISSYYLKLGLIGTINNLESDITDIKLDFKDAAKVIENFKPDYAAKVMHYIDPNMASSISENVSKSYSDKLDKELKKYEQNIKDKQNLANIYSNKKPEDGAKNLQNKDSYSVEDLGIIFSNMDYLSAAKILLEFEDKEYANSILAELKNIEDLNKTNENIAGFVTDVTKSMKVLQTYKKDTEALRKSYEKMQPSQIADLVKQMTTNKPKFKEYPINESKSFTISEEEMTIEILKNMKPKLLSQVIASLDAQKGAEISRKIGLPLEK